MQTGTNENQNFLIQLNRELDRNKTNKIGKSLSNKINLLASKIQERRRGEREEKRKTGLARHPAPAEKENEAPEDDEAQDRTPVTYDANEIIEEMSEESSYYYGSPMKQASGKKKRSVMPMKPYLKQLLKDVINQDFLYFMSDFMDTAELIKFQRVNQLFNHSIRVYLPTRLQQEADYINLFIEENEELNREFMKLVDTQIPISQGNWVCFDFLETLRQISHGLTNKDVSDIKFCINNLKEQNDVLLAPFCILLGEKSKRVNSADGTSKDIW